MWKGDIVSRHCDLPTAWYNSQEMAISILSTSQIDPVNFSFVKLFHNLVINMLHPLEKTSCWIHKQTVCHLVINKDFIIKFNNQLEWNGGCVKARSIIQGTEKSTDHVVVVSVPGSLVESVNPEPTFIWFWDDINPNHFLEIKGWQSTWPLAYLVHIYKHTKRISLKELKSSSLWILWPLWTLQCTITIKIPICGSWIEEQFLLECILEVWSLLSNPPS
ncbi:hypothetical protein BDR05DRAFT_949601 [Suillus weaverae]|nr:hypothetical protein BDR05DRAFT_949601 [Suillus weaverae]